MVEFEYEKTKNAARVRERGDAKNLAGWVAGDVAQGAIRESSLRSILDSRSDDRAGNARCVGQPSAADAVGA